ncbi:MAG: hypothetical protein ACO1Q7_07030 [Gemmatimonas sp.]
MMKRFALAAAMLAATTVVTTIAKPATANAQAAAPQAASVKLLGYEARVPATWSSKQAASNMRLAEYSAPGGAEVVVYFFGASQGGSVEANLARWKGQFTNPNGGAVEEKVSHEKNGAIAMTIAEYRGTYARGVGAGSTAAQALPNHILLAVVAETPKGTLFFQMYGPVAAVEAQRSAYLGFARSLK